MMNAFAVNVNWYHRVKKSHILCWVISLYVKIFLLGFLEIFAFNVKKNFVQNTRPSVCTSILKKMNENKKVWEIQRQIATRKHVILWPFLNQISGRSVTCIILKTNLSYTDSYDICKICPQSVKSRGKLTKSAIFNCS